MKTKVYEILYYVINTYMTYIIVLICVQHIKKIIILLDEFYFIMIFYTHKEYNNKNNNIYIYTRETRIYT
jgi:hypothetical protein